MSVISISIVSCLYTGKGFAKFKWKFSACKLRACRAWRTSDSHLRDSLGSSHVVSTDMRVLDLPPYVIHKLNDVIKASVSHYTNLQMPSFSMFPMTNSIPFLSKHGVSLFQRTLLVSALKDDHLNIYICLCGNGQWQRSLVDSDHGTWTSMS